MSRIHFHTKNEDDAEVLGSERAHAHLLTSDLALAALGLASPTASLGGWINPLIEALDPKIDCDLRYLSSLLRSGDDRRVFVGPDGTRHRVSSVLANTTLAVGSRPVRLLTRIHNQCEIHLWVQGKNRAWLADLIEEGMDSGVLRGGMGWDKVVTLLFGYGSDQIGSHVATADWIYEHSYHGSGVRIEVMDTKVDRPSDDYQRVELEDWKRDPVTGRWRPKEPA